MSTQSTSDKHREPTLSLTRRRFMQALGTGSAALLCGRAGWGGLIPAPGIDNPLAAYPSREWESVYRDQYRYDSSFAWVCAPNDANPAVCLRNCARHMKCTGLLQRHLTTRAKKKTEGYFSALNREMKNM